MFEKLPETALDLSVSQHDDITVASRELFKGVPFGAVSDGVTALWGLRMISAPLDELCQGMRTPTRRHVEDHILTPYSPRYVHDKLFMRDMKDFGVVYMPGDLAMGIRNAQQSLELEDHGEIDLQLTEVVGRGHTHVRGPISVEGRALVIAGTGRRATFGGVYRSVGRKLHVGAEKLNADQRKHIAGAVCGLLKAAASVKLENEAASNGVE